MRRLVAELTYRRLTAAEANAPASQICLDLFDVQEAVQKALIANNCQPL
jgi:hypothetical protein